MDGAWQPPCGSRHKQAVGTIPAPPVAAYPLHHVWDGTWRWPDRSGAQAIWLPDIHGMDAPSPALGQATGACESRAHGLRIHPVHREPHTRPGPSEDAGMPGLQPPTARVCFWMDRERIQGDPPPLRGVDDTPAEPVTAKMPVLMAGRVSPTPPHALFAVPVDLDSGWRSCNHGGYASP